MKLVGNSGGGKHSGKSSPRAREQGSAKRVFGAGTEAAPDIVVSHINSADESETASGIAGEKELGNSKKRVRDKKRRTALIAVCCVVAVIAAAVGVYAIWEKPPETNSDGPIVMASPEPTPRPTVKPSEKPVETKPVETERPTSGRNENCYTFLVAANDQLQANTDTLLVGRLDTEEGTLNIVSIPRDTLANLSWSVKKINTALAGYKNSHPDDYIDNFLKTFSDILGFSVDCYAIVNMKAVTELVDCVGGITYNVPVDMNYDDPTQNLHIHISAGEQLLNGEQAVHVLRYRAGYANADLGRIETQQGFMKAALSQMLTLGNIPNLSKAIEIFEENVDTNLTANNIAFFAREVLSLDEDSIHFATLPADGVSILGGSYVQIRVDDWLSMVNEMLNPYFQEITRENVCIAQYSTAQGGYTTSGQIAGGPNSFLDFSQYLG